MATALTPSPSSNIKHWWPRLSATRESPSYPSFSNLYNDVSSNIRDRPHTSPGEPSLPIMTSVTNPNSTAPNAFTVSSRSSSKFNLAAVIGFGSRSKKQQPLDIQDPPAHHRSLPISHTPRDFGVSPRHPGSPNPSLSLAQVSSRSATSRASTDAPLTPADDPASPGLRISYQHSVMTLTDDDPFATTVPLTDHNRLSAHSDKSLSKRLMQKIDGKPPKTSARLPVGDGPKKESRDRSATLPRRTRASGDALEAYQPLRAVEPPWEPSDHPGPRSMASPHAASKDHSKVARGIPSSTTLRHSKSSKPALPWPQAQVPREKNGLQPHQRTNSSSSISKEPLTDTRSTHTIRPSTSSSISQKSPSFTSQLFGNPSRPRSGSGQAADVHQIAMPSPSGTSSKKLPALPTHHARTNPRPPPASGLPPTPTFSQTPGLSVSSHSHTLSSPLPEQHSLRSHSGIAASVSSVSFASSISSLSCTSRPSPLESPVAGPYDYPSLLSETLPTGTDHAIPRGDRNLEPSPGLQKESMVKGPAPPPPANNATRNDQTPKAAKATLPRLRPLPSPPGNSPPDGLKRERTVSAMSPSSDTIKTLRKQRSFHNTSQQAPASLKRTLRHASSFDPSAVPGSREQIRSPSLPPLGSPPLPPPQEFPPLPPPPMGITKRSSSGKDSGTSPSPRRKLFGTNKHDRDRERERKHELDNVDTTIAVSTSSSGLEQPSSSSSWFDDRGTASEPASASSTSPSATHDVAQHIVPPAELLRLGAAWERENESRSGLRRAKSSWGSRDSDVSHTSTGSSSSKTPVQNSSGYGSSAALGSKLPRSASLLSKASSAPSFSRSRGAPPDLSFAPSSSALPPESYTSLSPPPPRRHRTISRTSAQGSPCFPPLPRKTPSALAASAGSTPPKGALIERKPSFLDMTSTRQSVTIDVPESTDSEAEEYEQDSFLELSRGMDSIDTIRESIISEDSFMQ